MPPTASSATRCVRTSRTWWPDTSPRGLTPEAAREAARREFGPVTQLVEESRDARGVAWLANGWQDLRYGARLHAAHAGVSPPPPF